MRYLLVVLVFFLSAISSAQNEAAVWYFGTNAGLDFNSGYPVPLLNGSLDTLEGCASISDDNGNLLLYTDGSTVWNANHTVMLNGSGLNGNSSSTQSALVIPRPGSANIYYIFTVQNNAGPNGLQYSEVDMTLDGGLGAVTSIKNVPLVAPCSEKISAIKSSNGTFIWVISHEWNTDNIIAFEVGSSGVGITPVVSPIGFVIGGPDVNAIGQMKVSPDGSKLAMAVEGSLEMVWLFDFDTATAQATNPKLIYNQADSARVYGIEFSPNSNLFCAVMPSYSFCRFLSCQS